jgi:hypothetical protein
MLTLFGMSSRDYRRFMNFLAAHDCRVGFREFREGFSSPQSDTEMPPVSSVPGDGPPTGTHDYLGGPHSFSRSNQ